MLTFASDHGLYDHIEAFGNGDSGIYPGSGPEGHCKRYGIEIRNVNSHDNVLGYSGTAGNGTWTHNSRFHDNNAGISDDSFASGHPGMPQDCSKWTANEVYSNNENYFTNDRDAYCKNTPFEQRSEGDRVPAVPGAGRVGLHLLRRQLERHPGQPRSTTTGARACGCSGCRPPSAARTTRRKQFDTSNGNRFIGNEMGVGADGRRAPNGVDFFWDEQGIGNCWLGNRAPGGTVTSDPATLPQCPEGSIFQQSPNPAKFAAEVPVRRVGPGDHAGPARLHLVHHPARAPAMKWAVAATVVLLAGVGALLLVGDRDGATQAATGNAQLQWKTKPSLILVPELPRDRILTGRVRNASLRAVDLASERVQILDAAGHRLHATALFAQTLLARALPVVLARQGLEVRARPARQVGDDQAGAGRAPDAVVAGAGRRLGAGRGALRRRLARAAPLSSPGGRTWLVCRAWLTTPSMPARTSRSAARPTRSSGSTRCSRSSTSRGCPSP